MEMNKKLHKLLFQFPVACIYGNEGDYSRYRMLKLISNIFVGKDLLVNKYLRDKVNIVVFPNVYGDSIFAVCNDEVFSIDIVDQLKEKTCDWLFIPGNENIDDKAYIFPISEVGDNFKNICEAIFVESFPFGKKEFCDYVLEFIKLQGITCYKCIVLYDEGRKYGATDISDGSAGIENVNKKFSNYVDRICHLSDYKTEHMYVDIRKSYVEKKRVMLSEAERLFSEDYDSEFSFLRQRWLCNEDNRSILTDSAFEYISDYKRVKNSDNIEKKMFDNMVVYLSEKKSDVCNLIRNLISTYLIDFVIISDEQIEKHYKSLLLEINRTYSLGRKMKCPDNKLDYRVLCSNEQFVIKLRTFFERIFDNYLKSIISMQIKHTLEECEVEYNETIKV